MLCTKIKTRCASHKGKRKEHQRKRKYYCRTNEPQTNCTITVAITNFKTAAAGHRNVANHCQTARQNSTKTTVKLHSCQWLMVRCNSRWIEYLMKMKFIKCYNDTQYRYSHRQIKPIKQQAHFKNILHVPTSAAVMKTARQTAICTCTICRKQITSSVTLIETLTKLTLSKKRTYIREAWNHICWQQNCLDWHCSERGQPTVTRRQLVVMLYGSCSLHRCVVFCCIAVEPWLVYGMNIWQKTQLMSVK